MIINSVKISNFKNFEDVEVKLGKMNVLVGANASGKTNFIEALKFLRNLKNYGLENAISLSGGAEFFQNLRNENKVTRIEISFESSFKHYIASYKQIKKNSRFRFIVISIKYIIEIEVLNNQTAKILREELIYRTKIEKETTEASSKVNFTLSLENGVFKETNSFKNQKMNISFKNGTSSEIDFEKVKINSFLPIAKTKSLIKIALPLRYLSFSIYDFDLKKAKQSTHITSKVDLEENGENLSLVVKKILADKEKARSFSNLVSDALPFIKMVEMDNFYRQSVAFNVQEQHSEARFPSALLSDGTIAVTAIIAALFFEKQPFMVFEEPEHGVHPALIAKLVQYFYDASEKKQIIITTHNPEIVKHIQKLEDLLLVSRDEKGFAQISRPIEQEMVKAFLENELGIDELFTQNLLEL
ncbi:MAG: AAA family ATPase [Chitinophagales bacterium]